MLTQPAIQEAAGGIPEQVESVTEEILGEDRFAADDLVERSPVPWTRNLVASVACLAVSATILINVNQIEARGSGLSALNGRFWPVMLAIGLIAIAIAVVIVPLLSRRVQTSDLEPINLMGLTKLVLGSALMVGFVLTWGIIQFGVSAALITAAMTFVFGGRNIYSLLVFPAMLGLIFHFLFIVALKVPIQ